MVEIIRQILDWIGQPPQSWLFIIIALVILFYFFVLPILMALLMLALAPTYMVLKNLNWGWWRILLVPLLIILGIIWIFFAIDIGLK